MKWIADTIKAIRYRRLVKRSLEPRKEFMQSSREAFLAEVAKRRVAPFAPQFAWRAFGMQSIRYVAVFAAVALIGTTGLVAYADTNNVGVTSPLYPLKRVGEQVRLTVVPTKKELELRREIAQRRASELAEIETTKQPDHDGDVEQLRTIEKKEKELRAEFRKHVEVIESRSSEHADAEPAIVAEPGLCHAVQIVEKHDGNGKSERYKKFEERCKESMNTGETSVDTTTISAPTRTENDHQDRVIEEARTDNSHTEHDQASGDQSEQHREQQ